jgi:hypothetical protein
MATHQSPLAVLVKGSLAGLAGTAVMSAFQERAPELMGRAGLSVPQPPAPPTDPDAPDSPTEELAERVTEGELAPDQREIAGEAIHWAYGAGWGAYFGVMQSTFRPSSLLHGAFLGGLMTLIATRFIPRLGLVPPPKSREELVLSGSSHVVYGLATAITYRILNLGRRG